MTIDLSKIKIDLIVKNRKAELYLEEVRKDYYQPLLKDYYDCVRHVKNLLELESIHGTYMLEHKLAFLIDP